MPPYIPDAWLSRGVPRDHMVDNLVDLPLGNRRDHSADEQQIAD
jgi:hypothetical protein